MLSYVRVFKVEEGMEALFPASHTPLSLHIMIINMHACLYVGILLLLIFFFFKDSLFVSSPNNINTNIQ